MTPLRPEDFAGDAFLPAHITDVRDGDIVRIRGGVWQVLHTVGFVFVARHLATGEQRHFAAQTSDGLEKRAGEPLPVES